MKKVEKMDHKSLTKKKDTEKYMYMNENLNNFLFSISKILTFYMYNVVQSISHSKNIKIQKQTPKKSF